MNVIHFLFPHPLSSEHYKGTKAKAKLQVNLKPVEFAIQFSPQPVSRIRKLAQASYPHPSEGRQSENYNQRKLTKLITWITSLPNSMKL